MHIIIGLIGIIGAAYYWAIRAKNAAEMAKVVAEVPNDIRLAARRFGFRRQLNKHSADSVDEPKLAIAGITIAFFELGSLPTEEQKQKLFLQVQSVLDTTRSEAEELLVLGRWLINECGGNDAGIARLSKRLNKIAGADGFSDLLALIKNVLGESWNQDQLAALNDVKRAFGIR